MALTRAQIQTAFQNSLGRAASQSDENSFFAVSQSGALSDAQIFSTISNSREADLNADPVVRFYQAAFGRVPDQAGLDNATDYVRAFGASAATYQNLSNMFAQSQEFTNRFGTGTAVDAAYVQALYSTILGRSATSGEVDGYVSGAAGYTTRGGVLYAVSQSQEAISVSDAAVNGFLNNAAQGQAVYSGSIYTTQNGQPNQPGQNGQNLAFTVNPDSLTGGAGNDTFTGVTSSGIANTFGAADRVDGGAGTDTLRLISQDTATAVTLLSSNISNVEALSVTNVSDGAVAYTATGVVGIANVINDASTQAVTVGNLGAIGSATIRNTAANTTVTYADAAVTGAADAVTVNVSGVTGAAQVNINSATADASGVETLNVVSSGAGTNSITLNTNDTGLTRIAFSGGTAATVVLGNNAGTAATIDGSGMTAALSVTGIGLATTTITGGTGNDLFNFGANFTAADVINGGAGTDTLGANAAQFGALTARDANVTNIETAFVVDDFTADTTVDVSFLGATNFRLAAQAVATTGSDDLIVNGLASGANVRFDGDTIAAGGSLTLNVANATLPGSADVLNLDVRGTSATSTFAAAGVETINVDASNAATAHTLAITDAALTTLNITNTGAATFNTGTLGANVSSVNASGVTGTGGVTITLNGTANTGANVIGSGNADIITGSNQIDVINGGAGADRIIGGGGADRLTGGAGVDDFRLTAPTTDTGTVTGFTASAAIPTTAVSTLALDKIADFGNGADTITLSGLTTGTALVRNGGTLGADTAGDVALVRGDYNATTEQFTANTSGTSSLFVYDDNGTTAVGAYRGVVLVGYVDAGNNDTVNGGVFTSVA